MKGSLNILIAEDDELNRMLICEMLSKHSHVYTACENGSEAVQMFRNGNFDCVLLDLQMPVMGGKEAAEKIREIDIQKNTRTKIAVLSGRTGLAADISGIGALFDCVLTKPFGLEDLQNFLKDIGSQSDGGENTPPDLENVDSYSSSAAIEADIKATYEKIDFDLDFFEILTQKFEAASEDMISKIGTAIQSNDRDAVTRYAHMLKGTISIFSQNRGYILAKQLENFGQTSSPGDMEHQRQELADEIRRINRAAYAFIDIRRGNR